MNFCRNCGAPVTLRIPPGDDRPRYICDACHIIHYENPKMVVGCIPEWEDKILLCRRAIEPRYGLWTLPAGYLENGETLSEGVRRETLEEAGARVEVTELYTVFNLIHISQVYLIFRARLLDRDFKPGKESLEVRLFGKDEIAWDDLAFTAIKETLRLYFYDRPSGAFPLHMGTIPPH
ncbi:MAG: NUDIX hydrolase [Deltaproteobacteria bacterium]|nr:NUDIX hydrolase [Deltaproteobacteria bacterium]MBW2086887.1 NUDIX hydrolase [Deltaproteobacteria bacterium]